MAEDKVLKYQITTEDGKVHNVSKSNIDKYGWGGYAEDYPKATVRMRDANNEDYDIPIAQVDNALTNNFRPFTTQFNKVESESAKKPQEQAQQQQEQGPFKPTIADDAKMAELMSSVGGTLYGSEQSRKQLGQPFNPELDVERAKLGEQTPDIIGKRYEGAVEKMQFGPDVEGTRQQLENDIKNDLVESRREDSKATNYIPYTGISAVRSQKTANLEAASAFLDSADMIQKAATAEGGWTSDLARGVMDAFRDPATLTFGMSSADQYRSVYRAINKMDKGEQLSKDEQTLLDAAAYNMYVAAINNPNLPTAYTVGKGATESLPFMVEFFVNPISGVGKKAAKELAEYTVKKYSGKAIGKYLTGSLAKTAARKAGKFALGAAANVVPASAMALTTSAPRTVGGVYERMVGEVKPEVAADMRTIVYGGHEGGENVGKALAKSYAATTIENWSEFLGDQFGEVLPAVGKLFGKTKLGTKIMDSKVARMASGAYTKINATDVAKTIKDIEQAVQFNGTFGEFAEEVAGGVVNAIVVGDQELNAGERGVFNPDNLIDTYLTCAVIGALPAGARLTGYAASKLTNTKLKAADAAAGKAMGDSWPQMRDQIINASNEARADYLKQVVTSPVFSAEDKKAVLTFVGEVAKKEAAKEFRQMQKNDPAYSAYQNKKNIINNYNEVSSAIGDEQRSILDSYASYTDWHLQNSEASEEQKEDAELYFSAREDMYKYVDEMNARIRERVDARMQEVDNLTNQDTGEILTVRSNYYEQPVNIVGGRLAFDDAGNVDAQASDKIIYYVDNNGKRMMATPDKFASIVSIASAADMRQQVQQEEESGAWAEEEEEMSRPEIKTGSTVVTPDGRQGVVTEVNSDVVVVNVDGQDVGFAPSEVSVPMPQQAEMTPQPVAGQPEVQQVEQSQMQQQEPEVTTQPEAQQDQQPVGTTVQASEQATQQPEAGTEQQTEGTVQQPETQAETHGQTSPIPQDEKGEYLFTQVPAEQTYAYLNTQEDLTPEEARMIVDQNIQEAQKRMKKLEGKGPKPTSNLNEYRSNKAKWEAEKQQAQADLDYWNQVKAIGEQMAQQEEAPGEEEAIEVMSHTEPLDGEELAAQLLSTGAIKITRDSYLKETGFKSEEAKRMFGLFASPDKGGVSIERAGELLELASREDGYNFFPEGEANAGRNAILSVLLQARTRGDLYRFISNRREEQARREQEAAQAAYADFIERKFGMTVEEYEAYEDMRTQQVLERSLSEADKDAIIEEFISEEPVKQEEDGTAKEQQSISTASETGSEVLQGEQPVYAGGTERAETESGEAGGGVVGENGIAPAGKVKGSLSEKQKYVDKNVTGGVSEYRYGMTVRPFGIGNQPDGALRHEDGGGAYGTVVYDHPLTEEEAKNFNLTPLTEAESLVGKRFSYEFGGHTLYCEVLSAENGRVRFSVDGNSEMVWDYYEFMHKMKPVEESFSDSGVASEDASENENGGSENENLNDSDSEVGVDNTTNGGRASVREEVRESQKKTGETEPIEYKPKELTAIEKTEDAELTESEINSTDFDQVLKDNAIAYINGSRTIHAQVAYKQIYDYVRNRPGSNESDSQPADGTQLDGRINESERGEGRQSGGQTEPVDRGASEENVPGERTGVPDGERGASVPDGTEGGAEVSGEESANDGVPAGTSERKGGRRAGSKGDNVRTRKGGRRSKSDTQVVPEPIPEAKSERDSLIDELNGLLDDFTKAGKGELSVSVVGMNSKQIEILSKIVVVSAKIGYTYIKEGVYKFQQWSEVMKEKFAAKTPLASVLNFTDADIDEFINDTWNSPFTIDGGTRLLKEWAAMMEKEDLRKKVRSTLEEKREAQRKAEGVEIKIGNRANISETLPFLLPEQQEDVMRAETQFFDESHNDRDHAFGKGYLFTNGTGTGKTYTGLGIVKRFVKQGKGRVLILTPSQAKVSDWENDGKNLGLDITPLESTKDKGKGVVITTFANFRSNKALFEDVFDLVVYDESHRIMENKEGTRTAGVANHFMITNKNQREALERMKKVHPLWIEQNELISRRSQIDTIMSDSDIRDENYAEKEEEKNRIDNRLEEISKEQDKLLPDMEKKADEAVKRTKVVFLSATPFNTIKSLDYAEGYIFSYPEENKNTIGSYGHRNPREEFLEKNFGAGFRFRYGRIEEHVENAEALSQQEVQFSDYLENTLGTKSGRVIDSEYDYSRDFPTVTFQFAPIFNGALEDIYFGDEELTPLSRIAGEIFNDYNYSTALFETMKVSAVTPRIKEHLAKGRKVVIFHRRVSSKEQLQPPFAFMLGYAETIFNNTDTTTEEGKIQKKLIRNAIDKFKKKYNKLLQYEQTLNYKLPRVQIADAFGEDNVLFFSGQESKKVKNEAIAKFNDDSSGKNIIVIQEESGKEGISLHDTTGNNQRVLISLALPQSPITALQIEGRIYRIGNKSNAIFEYPLLGLNQEINLFAQKFNQRVSTTENLALGSLARNLRASFADGVIDSSGDVPLDSQGVGGKERDNAGKTEGTDYDKAVLDFYGTQKITGTRDSRDGKDFYPTPEPVGFKMVEWARIQEGEDVLEPSAGMGAIARYVPNSSSLTAVEPSQKLFPTLQLKAGGFGRKFIMDIFENLNIVNKYDAILMNPPFGSAGATAIAHVDKAFKHLNEGGRIVALIPRGSTDKKFDKWYQETESAVLVGEVILPSVTFAKAGTSVNTRVVIIDKVSREELRRKTPMMKRVDLSYAESLDKEDGLFEALRDITMPPRTIDQTMIDQKNAKKTYKAFKDVDGIYELSIKEDGVSIHGRYFGMNFNESFESMRKPEVYAAYKNRLDNISSQSNQNKRGSASIQFLETVLKTIENVTGKTGDQIMDSLPKNEGGIKMSDKYKYVLDMHSKTGADMHLSKPIVEGSLSNEEYTAISRLAKKHGGYWNRTKKAFHFNSAEQAEAFINDSVELEQVRYRIDNNEPLSSNESYADAIEEISSKVGYSVSTVTGDQISGPDSDIKRKAKAWYDPNTDTVTINLDNVVSAEDAQRSYLHEVIGHYGLRELFGEQFDDAMFDIYGLLPKNVQEEIQNYMKKNYSSQLANMSSMKDAVVLSMEEYLSRKAEENPDASWWNRICGSIRNLMRRIGIGIKFNDNDVRYLLWRSKNNLNKGRNLDYGKPIPQYVQPRFRMDEENVTINEEELKGESVMEQAEIIATTVEIDESERENLERRIRNTRIREGWQDRMIAVKIFQEKISEVTGKSIKSWENAYDYENTIASRSQYFIDEFKEKMMKPIYASIAKFKDQNEVRDYLKAKHGLERNQKMREREVQRVSEELEADLEKYIEQWTQKLESATDKEKVESEMRNAIALTQERITEKLSKVKERESKKDYSGLTGLYNRLYATEDRVSIKQIEDKFNEFVSSYEYSNAENISKLWESIKGATNFTLDFLHDTNVLSKDMLDKLKSQYEYYIPLREWQEKRADQEFEYFSDHISDAFTDPLKKAKGRTSESGDPIASIMNMAQSSIFIGHKNMMKLNFLRLVRNNRTSLANISSLWYVKNEDGQWEEVAADLDGTETYEEAQEKIANFEERMKAKKELGLAKRKKSSLNLGMPIKKWQARQHEVRVKELGQEYIVYINTDPRIAQAINGLNNINLSARKYAKPVNAIKTFMTTSYTTKNIAFIGSNMLRDFILSFTNSFIKEGAGYSGRFLSSIGKATKDLGAYIWGGKISPELETFLKNGGETGFVSLLSYEESMKEVQKGVDKYKKTLLAKNFFSVLGMVVERINRHVENIFRFGIFLASRKSGKNVSESVKDAKEITVNFNRKGSGAYGSAYANMAYFFLNAGIQGLNNTIETASKNKTRALIAYSFWAGLGYLIPTLLCGDDDDDNLYDQIPNFIRRQNICIPNGKNGYITIPLPIEIRALFSIGDMAYRYQKGTYNGSDTEFAADLFGTIMEVMPKDFISGGNYELDFQKAIFFNAMPDIVKPITDTYIVNTTWTGRPIKKETPYNKYVPEYRKVYNGTNEYLVAASKFINKISGGNYAEKGTLDGPFNNPASLEYMIQQYMGGAARTYYQAILSTIRAIDPDKELATKDIPVVNRFYKPTSNDRPMTNVNERYFEYVEMFKEYESQKREYKRGLKEGENLSGDFEEFMRRNKEGISSIIDGSSTAIQQLNTVRPFLNDEGQEELDKEIYKIRKDAVDQIDKLKEK